jgi:potassium-transporting ATPase KdpC subunit
MFWTACKVFITMTVLTGCLYPLLITEIAQLTMPSKANGSLLSLNGEVRGSELIAQPFKTEKYFWPRPSAVEYNPLHSGGSNLGPSSQKLKEIVEERAQKLSSSHTTSLLIPPSLLYSSGSGIDPHLSVEGIYFQLKRVSNARNLSLEDQNRLSKLIEQMTEGRAGIWGPRYINVLQLNQKLDQQFSMQLPL